MEFTIKIAKTDYILIKVTTYDVLGKIFSRSSLILLEFIIGTYSTSKIIYVKIKVNKIFIIEYLALGLRGRLKVYTEI